MYTRSNANILYEHTAEGHHGRSESVDSHTAPDAGAGTVVGFLVVVIVSTRTSIYGDHSCPAFRRRRSRFAVSPALAASMCAASSNAAMRNATDEVGTVLDVAPPFPDQSSV